MHIDHAKGKKEGFAFRRIKNGLLNFKSRAVDDFLVTGCAVGFVRGFIQGEPIAGKGPLGMLSDLDLPCRIRHMAESVSSPGGLTETTSVSRFARLETKYN